MVYVGIKKAPRQRDSVGTLWLRKVWPGDSGLCRYKENAQIVRGEGTLLLWKVWPGDWFM